MKKSSNTSSTTSSSKMDETLNIKVVRLQSGEDVIADVISDDNNTILQNPMVVLLKRSKTGSVMMMVPWLPVELISDNIATLNNSEILTYTNPKESLVEFYLHMVEEVKIETKNSDKALNQKTKDFKMSRSYESEYDLDLEDNITTIDELVEHMSNTKGKKTLH